MGMLQNLLSSKILKFVLWEDLQLGLKILVPFITEHQVNGMPAVQIFPHKKQSSVLYVKSIQEEFRWLELCSHYIENSFRCGLCRTAIVVFELFLQMVLGQKFDAGDVIEFLCRVALGAYV